MGLLSMPGCPAAWVGHEPIGMPEMTEPTACHSATNYRATNDWDIRVPEAILHFGPVLIALVIAFLSLAGRSVFDGFEERETGTHLSVLLMVSCGLIALAAALNPANPRQQRRGALLLAVLIGVAIADELEKYHERIGKWVKEPSGWTIPNGLAYHADDLIVLGGAIAGALFLLWLRRRFPPDRALDPYFVAAVFTATAHGVVDFLSHGTRVPRQLFPEMTRFDARTLTDWLGVYEEAFKLWAEWFILLFLLRLLHRRDGRLGWAVMVMTGSLATLVGLWATRGATPYMPVGEPFIVLRNPHALFLYAALVVGWSVAAWMKFPTRPGSCYILGLGWLMPFGLAVLGPVQADHFGAAVYSLTHAFIPGEYYNAAICRWVVLLLIYVLPGVTAGALVGLVWRKAPPVIAVAVMGVVTTGLLLICLELTGLAATLPLAPPLCGFFALGLWLHRRGKDDPPPRRAVAAATIVCVVISFAATLATTEHLLPFRQTLPRLGYFEVGWAEVKPWSLRSKSRSLSEPRMQRR